MLIQPDTYIRLIKNCPIDSNYNNTIYFYSIFDQTDYFKKSLDGITFTKQSYQRYADGVIHLQRKGEDIYDCNYLMFQNSSFGEKWFYAFITKIESVNNVSCKVHYEIDIIQTWFWGCDLKTCFVEREHTLTDNPGEHLVEEHLDTGEYMINRIEHDMLPFPPSYSVVIAQGKTLNSIGNDNDGQPIYPCVNGNAFTGISYLFYNNPSEAYKKLQDLSSSFTQGDKSSEVIAVFQVPYVMEINNAGVPEFTSSITDLFKIDNTPFQQNYDFEFKDYPTDTVGYKPKNNKLYTEPFYGLVISSSSGANKKYAYEYFEDGTKPEFDIDLSLSTSPIATFFPKNYKGVQKNIHEELVCTDFPLCAYSNDGFKQYLAGNAGKIVGDIATTAGAFVINPYLGAIKAIGTIAKWRDIAVLPDSQHGSVGNYLNYLRNTVGFMAYQYSIRKEFAQIIDGYFDMYGYAVNTVKVPNISSRPYWNYVKTNGCVMSGNAPASAIKEMCKIFDAGIRFWKDPTFIGKYLILDNSPILV